MVASVTISRDANQSLALAALEQDLERADAEDQEEQAPPVHLLGSADAWCAGSGT